MKFNEYLLEIINRNGWSKNYISQKFAINRGALHKYFNGTLLLPKEILQKILDNLIISQNERMILFDLYYAELYGNETMNRIKALEYLFLNIDVTCIPDESLVESAYTVDFESFEKTNMLHLNSQEEILSAVKYLFKSNTCSKIYTNFPYSCTELDNIVYNCCLKFSTIELIHLLYFNKTSGYSANLQNIFCSIRYLKNRINPIYRYIYGDITDISPFPFFFIANNCCLCFSPTCKYGFLCKNSDMFNTMRSMITFNKYNATYLAEMPVDMIETKNIVAYNVESAKFILSDYPCTLPIADAELINSILREDVSEIHTLAQIAIEHYASISNYGPDIYVTNDSGLREFAETGKVFEVPSAFIKQANASNRVRYFKKLKQINNTGKIKVISNKKLQLPKAVSMEVFEHWVLLTGAFENVPEEYKCSANWIVKINDMQIVEDLQLFVNYCDDTQNFISQKGTESFLNSMIIYVENSVEHKN